MNGIKNVPRNKCYGTVRTRAEKESNQHRKVSKESLIPKLNEIQKKPKDSASAGKLEKQSVQSSAENHCLHRNSDTNKHVETGNRF